MKTSRTTLILSLGMTMLVLAACGGGGDTASPASSTSPATVVSRGAITGFGSVHVNGQRFETGSTVFTINGEPGTQADLRVGHFITVHGHRRDNGDPVADRIECDDVVTGPVQSIDAAAGTLVVLGQTVRVDDDTSFDDNIPGSALSGVTVGGNVEVSGTRGADGVVTATRIEAKPAGVPFEVIGVVSALDSAAHKFNVTALVVDYSAATLQNFPGGQPRDGDLVKVKGPSLNAAGELTARTVSLRREDDDAAGTGAELEGPITRFVSATDFDVAGSPVTTDAATVFRNGTAADLALDVKVEAEGTVNSSGVLLARKVEFKRRADSRISAPVDSVDAAAGKLVVLGIDVTVNDATRVEDKGDGHHAMFNLSQVTAGDFVEVCGVESPAGSNDVIAKRLERRRPRDEVRLRGIVDSVSAPTFSILGVTIQTNADTRFESDDEDENDDDDPGSTPPTLDSLLGKSVAVKGTVSDGVLTAREVEFEDEDGDEHD